MRDLEKLKVDDLKGWYQRYYSPANAILVVVGDVDPKEVISMAKKYYGGIKGMPVEKPAEFKVPEQTAQRRITVEAPANVPYLIMGFHVPAVVDRPENEWEPYALEVLSAILDGGDAARFSDQLIRGQEVASAAGSSYDPFARLAGYFTIDANPARDVSVDKLEQAILGQLKTLQDELVPAAELDRVKAQMIASDVYERDSVFYQAMKLGLMEATLNDWRLSEMHTERLKSVTPEQVREVARKYFRPKNMTVARLDPLPIVSGNSNREGEKNAD
jgi:zinc protease